MHNIISLQLLTGLHLFLHTITSNNLKPGNLHTVSFDPVKKIQVKDMFFIFRGMEGIGVAVVGGIDMVQFALGILFILTVIRQLVTVVGHSVDEPITRTLTC